MVYLFADSRSGKLHGMKARFLLETVTEQREYRWGTDLALEERKFEAVYF